jgi:DNA-binding LytR/AlgR family response regulator
MANCMIVDDEPLSRDVLRKYIARVRDLELVAACPDAFEAIHLLGKNQVDILFLDINLPGLSGISMARSLTYPPLIIFTTAYPQFAVEGFELDALDYLVKPYSFERFMKAVNRALERLSNNHEGAGMPRKIMLKADKKLYAVEPDGILFLEGRGDYVRVHLESMNLVVHETLKNLLDSLPREDFMRIHKSYVVNLKKIGFLEGNRVGIATHTLPVSPAFKETLLERFSAL